MEEEILENAGRKYAKAFFNKTLFFSFISMGIVYGIVSFVCLKISHKELDDSLSQLLFPLDILTQQILTVMSIILVIISILYLIVSIKKIKQDKKLKFSISVLYFIFSTIFFICCVVFIVNCGMSSEIHNSNEEIPSSYYYMDLNDLIKDDEVTSYQSYTKYDTSDDVPINYKVDQHKGSARLITECVEINSKEVLDKYFLEVISNYKSAQSDAEVKQSDDYSVINYRNHGGNNLIDVFFIKNNKLYHIRYSNYAEGDTITEKDIINNSFSLN